MIWFALIAFSQSSSKQSGQDQYYSYAMFRFYIYGDSLRSQLTVGGSNLSKADE